MRCGSADVGTVIFTDGLSVYDSLPNRQMVKHSVGEYVRGQVHTNGIGASKRSCGLVRRYRRAYPVGEKPRGLLCDAQVTVQLHARHALETGSQQEHGDNPVLEADL